jgi:hypothetical protein
VTGRLDGVRNSTEDTDVALECAALAARRYLLLRSTFRANVVGVARQLQKYRRAAFQIERRSVVLRTEPMERGSGLPLFPLPQSDNYDPWSVDVAALERDTLVSASCPDCAPDSTNDCATCAGTHAVHAWLSVHEEKLTRVVVGFKYIAARVHPNVGSFDDFDREVFPARLDGDTGWEEFTDDLPTELEPNLDPTTERIGAVRIQTFVAPIFSVTYRLPQGRATIEIAGLSGKVLPWSNFNPLKLRLVVFALCGIIALAVGALATLEFPLGRAVLVGLAAVAVQTALLRSPGIWSMIKHSFPRRLGGIRFDRSIRSSAMTRTAPTH